MEPSSPDQLIFHLTGRCQGDGLTPIDGLGLRPAMLAPYRELAAPAPRLSARARSARRRAGGVVRSLSSLVDAVLQDVAPRGIEGERLRRHALQLEEEIRRAIDARCHRHARRAVGAAAATLGAREGETLEAGAAPGERRLARRRRAASAARGDMPAAPASRMPGAPRSESRRVASRPSRAASCCGSPTSCAPRSAIRRPACSRRASGNADRRAAPGRVRLRRACRGSSPAAHRATSCPHRAASAWSGPWACSSRSGSSAVAAPRRRLTAPAPFEFAFDNCAAAARAFRERMPQLTELVKALAIAELEADGRYVEAEHDKFFDAVRRDVAQRRTTSPASPTTSSASRPTATTRRRTRACIEMLSSGPAGQGAGADLRPLRGSRRSAPAASHSACAARAWRRRRWRWAGCSSCSRRAPTCTRCAARSAAASRIRGAGAVQRVLRAGRGRRRAAALPDRRRRVAVARLSGLQLRRIGGRQLGGSLLAGEQPAGATTTGRCENVRVRRHGDCSASPSLGVHVRRLRAVRPRAIRRTSPACPRGAGARRCCRPPTGSRSTRARRRRRIRTCWPSMVKMRCTASRRSAPDAGRAPLPARCGVACRSTAASTIRTPNGCSRSRRRRGRAAQVSSPAASATAPAASPAPTSGAPAANGAAAPAADGQPPPRTRPTRPGSRPRAARAATNASSSTTACSPTTSTSRPISRTSARGPTASWSRLRKAARSRSSIPASRAIRTSQASTELIERARPFQ